MRVRVGTSGFSYDEWKPSFYPAELAASGMLAFYAERLTTVEINNTFYKLPKSSQLAGWSAQVPEGFQFSIKASRRITHFGKLSQVEDAVGYLLKTTSGLGDKLGALLFQLPPFLKKDVALLGDFLTLIPAGVRAAFEFRNPTWFSDDVFAALRAKDAAMCCGDSDEGTKSPPLVATASWGYLRLRADDYSDADLDSWASRISQQQWSDVYTFVKHEFRGPDLARALSDRFGESAVRPGLAKAKPREAADARVAPELRRAQKQ